MRYKINGPTAQTQITFTGQESIRLEMKHTFQYFLLRQKTPPIITNTYKELISRLKAR